VDEQIDCIIDQSTDVDILGRSWAGLETFMWFDKTVFFLSVQIGQFESYFSEYGEDFLSILYHQIINT
jgi:hypothetical protein